MIFELLPGITRLCNLQVHIDNGEILVADFEIDAIVTDDIIIHGGICIANILVTNNTLKVSQYNTYHKFNNFDLVNEKKFSIKKNDIQPLLRTDHLNTEERE